MKLFAPLLIALLLSSNALSQSFADKLYVVPSNVKLKDHRWSSKQGLDFDVVNHQTTDGHGVYMYIGVSESARVDFTDFVYTPILGKPIKLYETCEGKECRYTALVNTELVSHGREIWVQVWLKAHKDTLNVYLDWLSTLTFALKEPSSS